MQPQYADIELNDGTVIEGVRVTLRAKLAYEKAARANKWKNDEMPFTTTAFLAWAAARAAGHEIAEKFDEFLDQVTDIAMWVDDDAAPAASRMLPDPTLTAATTA